MVAARAHVREMFDVHEQKKKEKCSAKFFATRQNEVMDRLSATMKEAEIKGTQAACLLLAAETEERDAEREYKRAQELHTKAEHASLLSRFNVGAPRVLAVIGVDCERPSTAQLAELESLGCLQGEKQHYLDVISEELESSAVYAHRYKCLSRAWGMDVEPNGAGDQQEYDSDMTRDDRSACGFEYEGEAQVYDAQSQSPDRSEQFAQSQMYSPAVVKSCPQRCPSGSSQFDNSQMYSPAKGRKRSRDDDVGREAKKVMYTLPQETSVIAVDPVDVFVVQKHSQNLSLLVDKGVCVHCKRILAHDEPHCTFEPWYSTGICHPVCDLEVWREKLQDTIDLVGRNCPHPVLGTLRHAVHTAAKNVKNAEKQTLARFCEDMKT